MASLSSFVSHLPKLTLLQSCPVNLTEISPTISWSPVSGHSNQPASPCPRILDFSGCGSDVAIRLRTSTVHLISVHPGATDSQITTEVTFAWAVDDSVPRPTADFCCLLGFIGWPSSWCSLRDMFQSCWSYHPLHPLSVLPWSGLPK